MVAIKQKEEWSKSYIRRPEHNIVSHVLIKAKKFVPSYDKNCTKTSMAWVLGWEYGRVWLNERDLYIKKRDKGPPKRIKNDYENWIKKRDPKAKKIVKSIPKRPKTDASSKQE